MNLAKVEYYFSDFLSILESRTPDKPEGEPLILHDSKEVVTAYGDKSSTIPRELSIPNNIYITGTVNVDETTYMFSPKVLDRANVIEFNQIYLDGFSEIKENNFKLNNADVRASLLTDGVTFCSIEDYNKSRKVVDILPELIQCLEKYHLHFGYRVVNEISRFMWLAQETIHDFQAETALDIQLLQKVLPKLHGTRAKLDEPLQDLLAFCYSQSELISPEKQKQAMQFDEEALFPRTAQKLARMLQNLQKQGYASFIE
jgi:5-methylcytosine-specific restriction endonuclease McrBC GTP-binding regulatory subunit McrB